MSAKRFTPQSWIAMRDASGRHLSRIQPYLSVSAFSRSPAVAALPVPAEDDRVGQPLE
jgi:hypothetical protein